MKNERCRCSPIGEQLVNYAAHLAPGNRNAEIC